MRQSGVSALVTLGLGAGSAIAMLRNHTGASVLMGLLAVYFMLRSEVLHRIGL